MRSLLPTGFSIPGFLPTGLLLTGVLLSGGACVSAQPVPAAALEDRPPCSGEPYERLDFWLGRWQVRNAQGAVQGTDHIEKTLDGCTVLEHWSSSLGGRGESLFYFYRPEGRWKQVWVTGTGFVKEKVEVQGVSGPGLRFQGEVPYPGRGVLLDRTTLTPREDGSVRQLIEVSEDGGKSWRTSFEGLYVPAAAPPAQSYIPSANHSPRRRSR